MSTILKNPLLCTIFIICVFVLLYFIFFHNSTIIIEGATNMETSGTSGTIGIPQMSKQEIIDNFKTNNPTIYAKIVKEQEKQTFLTQNELQDNTINAINVYNQSISGNKTCVDPLMNLSDMLDWSIQCGKDSVGGTNFYTNYCNDNKHLCGLDDKNLTPEEQMQRTTFLEKCGEGMLGASSVCYKPTRESPNYTPTGSFLTRSDKSLPTPGNDAWKCTYMKDGESTIAFSEAECIDNSHNCTWEVSDVFLDVTNSIGPVCINNKYKTDYINKVNSSIISPSTATTSGASVNDDLYSAFGTIVNHPTTKNVLQSMFESLTGTNQSIGSDIYINPLNPNVANGANMIANTTGPTNLLSMLQQYNNPNIQAGATGLSYPMSSPSVLPPANLPEPMTCGGSMPYPYNCISTRIDI